MGNQKEYPVRFTPRGLSDAWDSSMTFPGACKRLTNLIFDQSNPEMVRARPGVGTDLTTFASFTNPTYISQHTVLGNLVYGMVATGRFAGHDEPFCYDLKNNVFITITGPTAGNTPTTQPISGDWTPPSMAVVGIKIIITHPGFNGVGANFFGVIDITNPAAPTWTSANTATNGLPSVPVWVVNYNNRAYFFLSNKAFYSDVLVPTTMTNAGQSLTMGDTTPIIGASGLPIETASGGVVASLIVFKQFQIWQITGDAAITGTLATNFLSLNVGATSAGTIVQTPIGTIFSGIDGPYYVSPLGQVLPLTKDNTKLAQDLQAPFQGMINVGRAVGSYTGSVYRICMETVIEGVSQIADYWFDATVRRWNGPHSFPYDCISPAGNYFVVSHRSKGAHLYKSQYLPDLTSVYNDDGTAISVFLEASFLPKLQNINVKDVIESTIELTSTAQTTVYTITAIDERLTNMSTVLLNLNSPAAYWGAGGVWGGGSKWNSIVNNMYTYTIPWDTPLVFKKLMLTISAASSYSLAIGTIFIKFRDCGYTNI